jgi:esterase/lipase superfamily enzyme
MELEALLRQVLAELDNPSARMRLRHELAATGASPSAVDEWENFLVAFIRAAVDAARWMSRTESSSLVKTIWVDSHGPIAASPRIASWVGNAYFTLRPLFDLAPQWPEAPPQAVSRGNFAMAAVGAFLGPAMTARSSTGAEPMDLPPPELWRAIGGLPIPHLPLAARSFRTAAPSRSAQPTEDGTTGWIYDVWFGTNRAPNDSADPSRGFSNERAEDGTVRYGTCTVQIPRTHDFGSLGTPFWKRWLKFKPTDDHLKLRKVECFGSSADFLASLREEMEALDQGDRSVLVYLHGYNTSFEEAALRAAQIGFDLKAPGATAFYSWPSSAQVKGYAADIARVEASETQIADFLTAVAKSAAVEKVHVIAHSMGNRGFGRAIARITAHATATSGVRFGQIILAAPDLDVDLFRQLAVVYPKVSERTTMYVCAKDKALAASSWLQDSNRAGFTPPITVLEGIDTVEVTNLDLTMLGHGYFSEAAPVLHDIKDLIDGNKPPEKRLRIEAKAGAAPRYWVVRP